MNENEISSLIIKLVYKIHKDFGPGLLESVYEEVLFTLIKEKGLNVERQVHIPVLLNQRVLDAGFRADLVVEQKVIIEIKSIEDLHRIHYKQLLTYLRLANIKLGLLINFNVYNPVDGYKRVVNRL